MAGNMETEVLFNELNAQLDSITHRLINIEEKLDAQAKSDHDHDLKLQKLELEIQNSAREINEMKVQLQVIKAKINEDISKDFQNLGDKIRNLEDRPDKQKANLVKSIADQIFKWLVIFCLSGLGAWIISHFKTN
jgi:archaellum component FlaC